MGGWTVQLSAAGLRGMDRLPVRIIPAAVEFLYGPLTENPERVGKPLGGRLSGLMSARRGEYRILYEVFPDAKMILVHRVAHRIDAYRPLPP